MKGQVQIPRSIICVSSVHTPLGIQVHVPTQRQRVHARLHMRLQTMTNIGAPHSRLRGALGEIK